MQDENNTQDRIQKETIKREYEQRLVLFQDTMLFGLNDRLRNFHAHVPKDSEEESYSMLKRRSRWIPDSQREKTDQQVTNNKLKCHKLPNTADQSHKHHNERNSSSNQSIIENRSDQSMIENYSDQSMIQRKTLEIHDLESLSVMPSSSDIDEQSLSEYSVLD